MANQTVQTPLEIAFFDVETTYPSGCALLEFGSIIVCADNLVEVGSYSTLIRPTDPNLDSASWDRVNGITKATVANAPSFSEVAGHIFTILDGRIWAGHNIVRFDCERIREAFAEIGEMAPKAKGMIDTFPLLTQPFRERAGNMKMASLAKYFGLGPQKHRSLDCARMNLEVLKYCATVLFLESIFPYVIPTAGLMENTVSEVRAPIASAECSSRHAEFLEANEVSVIFHRDAPLQMCSYGIRVPFGVDSKFVDRAGWPKLSILVNVPDDFCKILDACERAAHKLLIDSGSSSEWDPVVKKIGYLKLNCVRLCIPVIANGDSATYATEIYMKEPSGNNQKLVFNNIDVATLEQLFGRGTILDAFFSMQPYDFEKKAGIRLVAKRLDVHSM